MAVLSALKRGSSRVLRSLLVSALLFVGACSFVLDTESLQSGEGGAGGSGGRPICAPIPDPCSNCLGQNCCGQYVVCTNTAKCRDALLVLQQCLTTGIPANCIVQFGANGGPTAGALSNCAAQYCATPCTS